MPSEIINLDQLRAPSRKILFLGQEFEIGYIPAGLSIPVLDLYQKQVRGQKESDSQEKLLRDNADMVSGFCSYYNKDFTLEYVLKTASAAQIAAFYQQVLTAIVENFASEGASEPSKKKETGGI